MVKDLEFVCTGNNGRSKLAEIIAKQYSITIGLDIEICSSGTMVDLPSDLTQFKHLVENAVNKGILKEHYVRLFDTNPTAVIDDLIRHEANCRNQYLQSELHLPIDAPARRQTIIRPEAQLILPIGANNLTKVKELYASSKYTPQIYGLDEYSGIASLEDVYPATYQEYRITANRVWRSTIVAMNKIYG